MKRVIFATISFCLIDSVLSETCYIDIRKDCTTDVVRVRHRRVVTELKEDEPIVFDKIGVGFWDGTCFFMTEGSLSDVEIEISSRDIPVIFDSFHASQCKVYSPGLKICGDTQVNELTAEFRSPKKDVLDVVGKLITKNLLLLGSSEINGEVYIQKDGGLSFKRPGVFNLIVNGKLRSEEAFHIHKKVISVVNVINNGEISSGTKTISCLVDSFINGENGQIDAEEGKFQMGFGGKFHNFGKLIFNRFFVQGRRLLNFLQKGKLLVQDQAVLDCSLESFGETSIHHLIFSQSSEFKVLGNQTVTDKISGEISILELKGGAKAEIGDIENGVEFALSEGRKSKLEVKKLNSRKRTVFSAQAGSSTTIKNVDAPEGFVYSDDAKLKVDNLKGKAIAAIEGTSEFEANSVENLSLFAKKDVQTRISDSNSKEAFLFGGKHLFSDGKAEYINNHSELRLKDIEVEKIENKNRIVFNGQTSVEKFSDYGESTFVEGEHQLKEYISSDSKLKVKGKEEAKTDDNENIDSPIILKDKGVVVSVDRLKGVGTIEANDHSYKQVLPAAFMLNGNAKIYLNYLPIPGRMPFHGNGDLKLNADMSEDYINQTDRDYKDTYITMNMHGHKWINRKADFLSGKLKVKEVSVFSNEDGHIDVDKDLDVDGKYILNTSEPKKELIQISQRHVQYDWFCSYYNDVFVDRYSIGNGFIRSRNGLVSLNGEEGVRNEYSRIVSGKKFNLKSKTGKVSNYLGEIISVGDDDSSIDTKKFENTCIPQITIQVGVKGLSFFCRRQSDKIYSTYNPSGSSNIYSGGNLFIKSIQNPIVRGSDISSEKSIYLEFLETSMNVINELGNSSQVRAGESIYLNGKGLNIRSSVFSALQDISVKTPEGQISITNNDQRTIKRPAIDIDVKKEIEIFRGVLNRGSFGSKSLMIDIPKKILPSVPSFMVREHFNQSKEMVINSNYSKLLPIIFSKYGILKSEFEENSVLKLFSGKRAENTTDLIKSDNESQLRFSFSLNSNNSEETELELDRLHIPAREIFSGLSSVKGKVEAEASQMTVTDSAIVGSSVKIDVKEKGQGNGKFSAIVAIIMANENDVDLHADNGSSIHSRGNIISHYHRNGNREIYWEELKSMPSMIGAKNEITISGGDTDIGGTKFKSSVFNDKTTNMRIGVDKARLHFWGRDKKKGLFSSKTICREGYMDVGTFSELDCETVNSSEGHGITLESVNANGVKSFICSKRVFNETAATMEYRDDTTVKSRGISFGKMSLSDPLADACFALAQANNAKAKTWASISLVSKAISTVKDVLLIDKAITSPEVLNPLSMALGIAGKRFINASISIGNKTEVIEKYQTKQIPTVMLNADLIKLDCEDSVHLQGLYQTKKLEIKTKELISEGLVSNCNITSKVTGWSTSINPVTALITYTIPGVGASVGNTATAGQAISGASSVSLMHQTQNVCQKMHTQTMLIAEDYNIKAGQAYLKDTQIRGRKGKVQIDGDLKIESSRDEYSNDIEGRSYSSSLGFLSAKDKEDTAGSLVPGKGRGNEENKVVSFVTGIGRGVVDIHETNNRVNNISALTAEDSFDLEVGGNFESISSYYGQKKLKEPITESRISLDSNNLNEQIKIKGKVQHKVLEDEYSYKDGSYNASIGDLAQVVEAIKLVFFDDDVEEGMSGKKIEEIKKDLDKINKKAEQVRKLVKNVKKTVEKGKAVVRENQESSANDLSIELLLNPRVEESSSTKALVLECFQESIWRKRGITPREAVIAFIPKNKAEEVLKATTLLRYEVEDVIAKYPSVGYIFLGAMYGLQGLEYVGALAGGPLGVAGKYASQEAISYALDTTIEETSTVAVKNLNVSPILKEEFKTSIKVSSYAVLCAGSIKASKRLVKSLVKSAAKGKIPVSKELTKSEPSGFWSAKSNNNAFARKDYNVQMFIGEASVGKKGDIGSKLLTVDGNGYSSFSDVALLKLPSAKYKESIKFGQKISLLEKSNNNDLLLRSSNVYISKGKASVGGSSYVVNEPLTVVKKGSNFIATERLKLSRENKSPTNITETNNKLSGFWSAKSNNNAFAVKDYNVHLSTSKPSIGKSVDVGSKLLTVAGNSYSGFSGVKLFNLPRVYSNESIKFGQQIFQLEKFNNNDFSLHDNKVSIFKGKVSVGESSYVVSEQFTVVNNGSSNFTATALLKVSRENKIPTNITETNAKTLQEYSISELLIKMAEHQYKHNPAFGHVAGTKSHKKAKDFSSKLLEKYGKLNGLTDKNIQFEARYFKGMSEKDFEKNELPFPKFGYSIYDVIDIDNCRIFDYKFNSCERSKKQIFGKKRLDVMKQNVPDFINEIYGIVPVFDGKIHTGKFKVVKVWDRREE